MGIGLRLRFLKKIAVFIAIFLLAVYLFTSPWFLKNFYPYPYRELLQTNCALYGLDPYFVLAIIKVESRFYSQAHSRAGALGLMQIMPTTGNWIASQMGWPEFSEAMLLEPDYNLPLGIWYLAYLKERFAGNQLKVIAAYNAGVNRVTNWLNKGIWSGQIRDLAQIPFPETRRYVERVLFNYQLYQYIYLRN